MYMRRYNVKTYDFNNDEAFKEWFEENYIQGKYQPRYRTLRSEAKREWIKMLNHQPFN